MTYVHSIISLSFKYLNVRENNIASRIPYFHVIYFSTALIFPSPLHNLIIFPNRLDKLRPGLRNFIQPLINELSMLDLQLHLVRGDSGQPGAAEPVALGDH